MKSPFPGSPAPEDGAAPPGAPSEELQVTLKRRPVAAKPPQASPTTATYAPASLPKVPPAYPAAPPAYPAAHPAPAAPLPPAVYAPPVAPPPVPPQFVDPHHVAQLESEKVVVAAPLSFAGSAARIWKITHTPNAAAQVGLVCLAIALVALAWTFVLCWYLFWGVWLVPYRLIRRGSRQRKRQALQHREMLAAVQRQSQR